MAPPERRSPRPEAISDISSIDAVIPLETPSRQAVRELTEEAQTLGMYDERPSRPPTLPGHIPPEIAAIRDDFYKPMAVVPVPKPDPFQVMDSWDDELVVRELRGEAPRGKLVYQFRQQGKDVIGLGKEGVDFCCQLLMHQGQVIRELGIKYVLVGDGDQQQALFQAKAGRFAVAPDGSEVKLDTVIGVKRQPLFNLVKSTGEWMLNPHWFEQGAMKAARNARFRLIPIALREEVMGAARAGGRVQRSGEEKPEDLTRKPSSDEQRSLYQRMLQSHHVTPEERIKATAWLEAKRHSAAAVASQIDALTGLLATRLEAERLAKTSAQSPA